MGMRDEAPEALEETPPWLVRKDTDKNKIENYYGYTDALYARGDFIPAMDLPGIHAKNKDPRYMTKQNCIDYAKEYYFVDLDPDIGIHKLRGEVRKLRLNPPPPKPEDEEPDDNSEPPVQSAEQDTEQESDQETMNRLWRGGVRPDDWVGSLAPEEVVNLEEAIDEKIAEEMGSGD